MGHTIQVRPHPFSCASGFATQCDRGRTTLLRKGEARRSGRSSRHAVDSLKEAAARRDPADGDKCDFTFAGNQDTPRRFTHDRHRKRSEDGSFRNISNAFWNPVRSTQIMRGCTEGRCQPLSQNLEFRTRNNIGRRGMLFGRVPPTLRGG